MAGRQLGRAIATHALIVADSQTLSTCNVAITITRTDTSETQNTNGGDKTDLVKISFNV